MSPMPIWKENDDVASRWPASFGLLTVALAGGIAVLLCARHFSASWKDADEYGFDPGDDQAVTVRVPLEAAEAAWVDWCASGHATLENDYAIRFEPAPGARGTEVHLSGGGSKKRIREELRRFKQLVETGEVVVSDGPGMSRPAQPPAATTAKAAKPRERRQAGIVEVL